MKFLIFWVRGLCSETVRLWRVQNAVAKFIVPGWGEKVDYGIGLSYRPARLHIDWQAGTTTLCRSQLYPPFREYDFGYLSSGFTVTPKALSPLPISEG